LSDSIQIQGKIVVHFLNKGGGGGGCLGEDLHSEKRGWEWPEGRITGGGASLEREREEESRKNKGGRRETLTEPV
jgi:hypothetical protein